MNNSNQNNTANHNNITHVNITSSPEITLDNEENRRGPIKNNKKKNRIEK